jgi:hypothetical protein
MKISRDDAIAELLKISKIDTKIETIQKVKTNELF